MKIIGEIIVLFISAVAFAYGVRHVLLRKNILYFRLIVSAVACHSLGYLFDACELWTTGQLSEGFTTGYLGPIGCFLFMLTASYGYMDGIIDDKTSHIKTARLIALIAPAVCLFLLLLNMFSSVPIGTRIAYILIWIPATFSSYFCLKHAIAPDQGFGFVTAIRPFNIAAVVFTFANLSHLTVWNFFGWIAMVISGFLLGTACLVMIVMVKRGVDRWSL